MLGGPDDPEGEIEKTLGFIRRAQRRCNPEAEIILYFYSPTPQRAESRRSATRRPVAPRLPVLRQLRPLGPGAADHARGVDRSRSG